MNISIIENNQKTNITTNNSQNILKLLQDNKIYIDAPCNANSKCGKCKIIVTGNVNKVTADERRLLSVNEINNNIRLACLTVPIGDCEVTLIENESFGVQAEGFSTSYVVSPRVDTGLSNAIGMAVDIGTTTIACYFYDLKNGKRLYTASGLNEQRAFGADVISRINSCIENENGLSLLQATIVKELNQFIFEFCTDKGFSSNDIIDVVIAGNTVMLHLLAAYNPNKIAVSPFTPTSLFGFDIKANVLGINVSNNTDVYLTDCVSGYVGGDITVGVLSSGAYASEKTCIFIDIGTNGEMAIGDKNGFICCATAAGPAFEGAHIKHGVGGIDGAINKVEIENGDIAFTTIASKPAIGICGSGLIDAIACLLKLGVVDETGRIDEENITDSLMYRYKDDIEPEFLIDINTGISITQKDIREVQLAKAAIAAGIKTLIHAKGLKSDDIEKVKLAGGFGSYIDKISACEIGLLPLELLTKIETVGNAAGMGAIELLLNKNSIVDLNELTAKFSYYELSGDSFFQDEYIEQMCF